jgi:nucleoside-diphosphate-sugar epimerase
MLEGDTCNLGVSWPVRNFLFITDLVEFYRVLLAKMPVGETFVTGPMNAVTIGELAELIALKLDWHGTINWNTVRRAPRRCRTSTRSGEGSPRVGVGAAGQPG